MDTERNLILPGNPRYQPIEMKPFFGYDNLYRNMVEVEIATLETLYEINVIPETDFAQLLPEIRNELLAIKTTKVDEIERNLTHHDVRALVREMQKIIGKILARWIHVPLTSYDVIDTGRILQFLIAYDKALKPSIAEVVYLLAGRVKEFASQLQIGRTHGQHALPITVGFWLATILNRILYNWEKMDTYANALLGKISGAVGARNAQIALNFTSSFDKKTFEKLVLKKLGLKPAPISTQILPPEPLGYFLFSCTMMSACLAQLGRDCRHLMRSEIAEISESFEKGQVGSSTMAHKRNPINFENLEGMWIRTKNEFGKVLDTLISEHQRDLVGSSVARDYPIILINLQHQLNTLTKKNKAGIPFLERISVNKDACLRNFNQSANVIVAEPLYIAMQMAGYEDDAHELVNGILVPEAQSKNKNLIIVLEEMAEKDFVLQKALKNIPTEMLALLQEPENYTGNAEENAIEIYQRAGEMLLAYH